MRSTSPPLGWKVFESSYGGPAFDCVHCDVWHAEVRIHRSADPVSVDVESAQMAFSRDAFLDQRLLITHMAALTEVDGRGGAADGYRNAVETAIAVSSRPPLRRSRSTDSEK
ncbi:hypothetical protein TRAPUB_5647 [Trametes pubescens]|uniref:Uncharacterized protein n=1 Tax=Trametes pubescens TaxID=154538 RepID=A0A1M2V7P2_TRAPU|nr:hypothetical protein TRAPUB_5647 [Trametes pubescens]